MDVARAGHTVRLVTQVRTTGTCGAMAATALGAAKSAQKRVVKRLFGRVGGAGPNESVRGS